MVFSVGNQPVPAQKILLVFFFKIVPLFTHVFVSFLSSSIKEVSYQWFFIVLKERSFCHGIFENEMDGT